MEIIDMAGRVMITDNITNNSTIDLSDLQKGCYLVKVMNNTSVYTSKVVVR